MTLLGGDASGEGARVGHAEAFLEQLCSELHRDARSTMHQLELLPGRLVRGFDGEPIAGLEHARWSRRPVVWGARERLEIVDADGSVRGAVLPLPTGGWTYELDEEEPARVSLRT